MCILPRPSDANAKKRSRWRWFRAWCSPLPLLQLLDVEVLFEEAVAVGPVTVGAGATLSKIKNKMNKKI
jgi:hypothetical protein